MRRSFLSAIPIVVALLCLVGEGDVRAQSQAKVSVTARAGYGDTGAYMIGAWMPVRVTLNNPGGADSLRVRVQVASKGADDSSTTGIYAREIDLPSPSHKEVTLYASAGGYSRRFRVQVLQGGLTIASADVDAEPFEPPTNAIIAVASSDTSLLNFLKGESVGHIVNSPPPGGYGGSGGYVPYTQPYVSVGALATIVHIKPDDLPTQSAALDDLAALVLDDVDTSSLSTAQRGALQAWISRGGTLLVTVRPGGADTTAGVSDLLPITVEGSKGVTSLDSISDFVGAQNGPPGQLPRLAVSAQVAVGDARHRAELASTTHILAVQDGVPLLAERDLGLGHVVYMGISPGLAPLKSWDGTMPLIKRLLADRPLRISYGAFLRFSPSRGYYTGSLYDTYGGMFAIPSLDLPSPLSIGFFLLLYIIILGPANFIVLRRMHRTELAWVTVPVLVGVFSVVAYLLAFQSKGGELVAIRANVISTFPDVEQATTLQHFGLFSPARRTYKFSLPADSLVTEMSASGYGSYQGGDGPTSVLGGNPTTINGVNIDTWSLKGYVAEHTDNVQSPLETRLSLGDNVIVGTIRNRTSTPLEDVALVRGDAVSRIGYLAPGQQIDVRMAVSSQRFDNKSPVSLIPPPSGVPAPQAGIPYSNYPGPGNSAEQRAYSRKLELLSAALYPLVADTPPTDMSVVVLAWGPSPASSFDVEGHSTNSQELNVWAAVAPVRVNGNEAPKLHSGLVPYTIYAPGNKPSVIAWNGASPIVNPPTGPYGVPTTVPTAPIVVTPGLTVGTSLSIMSTPAPYVVGLPGQPQGLHIFPYTDLQYRLPAGTNPSSLTFSYSIASVATDGDIDLLAYNVNQGAWDRIGTWPSNGTGNLTITTGNFPIPNPARYTSPAGDVVLRLQPKGTDATLKNVTLDMGLNDK